MRNMIKIAIKYRGALGIRREGEHWKCNMSERTCLRSPCGDTMLYRADCRESNAEEIEGHVDGYWIPARLLRKQQSRISCICALDAYDEFRNSLHTHTAV